MKFEEALFLEDGIESTFIGNNIPITEQNNNEKNGGHFPVLNTC